MKSLLAGLGLFLVAATALPFLPTPKKWIRIFDFPRLQIAALLLATAAAYLFVLDRDSAFDLLLMGALALALAWQVFRIFPYTPVAPIQVRAASDGHARSGLRIVIANVLMENRKLGALLRILRNADPDLVLLVETDAWWDRGLRALAERLPHSIRQPRDDTYGMVLYSRFPLASSRVDFLVDPEIPSVYAVIELPSGDLVAFHGVHPAPPPLRDTMERDAELLLVGRKARACGRPAIVAGDLNDVGWSATTRLFMRISGLLDPRRGRGFFASYHARNPLIRWPLDYIFIDQVFTIRDLRILPSFGSDHFPVLVDLRYEPRARHDHEAPGADGIDESEAAKRIRDGKAAGAGPDDGPGGPVNAHANSC